MAARKIARGALRQDPKYTTQPVKDGGEKTAGGTDDVRGDTKGARRAAERLARRTPTERLSPGVYRSASGDLVTQAGRPIQRRPQAPMAQQVAGGMQGGMGGQIASETQGMPGQTSNALTAANQITQFPDQQINKPYSMQGYNPNLQQITGMAEQLVGGQAGAPQSGYLDASGIGKTPPGWSGGPVTDMMYRNPQMPQMPQASANMGGQYRLSPGVYGSREQAMQQWAMQPAVSGAVNAPGSMSQIDFSQAVPYGQRRR